MKEQEIEITKTYNLNLKVGIDNYKKITYKNKMPYTSRFTISTANEGEILFKQKTIEIEGND